MTKAPSGFEPLEDHNIKIWRYMDFTKFVAMLEYRGLFLPRADKLGDPFEGSWPRSSPLSGTEFGPFTVGGVPIPAFMGRDVFKAGPEYVVISCWHMNEYESDAMWSRYGGTNGSVAIQSNYSLLRTSLPPEFHIGTVRYITFEKQVPQDAVLTLDDESRETLYSLTSTITNDMSPQEVAELLVSKHGEERGVTSGQELLERVLSIFLQKRKAFQHEQELRAIALLNEVMSDVDLHIGFKQGDSIPHPTVPGVWQPLDLSKLIEHVYVAPNARGSFKDLVEKVMTRYKLNVPVDRTSMDDDPIF